ncbi:MAG TPA: hypothetical protein VFA29_07010 [Candidatus Baltobacteraceae bacterium]|nr:hypothetical protein [Candidatus Baltobacteraceae bacterium]
MKRWSIALLAPLLLGAAPAPLLVGVVHDQYGQPIAGARVQFASQTTATDAAGTFSLEADAAEGTVAISCAYCAGVTLHATAGDPVIAVVQRFSAVADAAPNARDLRALQYSSAASAISLRPYAVLNDSSAPYPGPHLSLYGLSSFWGGLIVDDGVPNYDVAFAASTLQFLPAAALQSAQVLESADGFRYGTSAGAGTFLLGTLGDPGFSGEAVAGDERVAGATVNRSGLAASLWASGTSVDSRDRVDAVARMHVSDLDSIGATVIAASSREYDPFGHSLDAAFNAAKISYDRAGALPVHADLLVDGTGYNGNLYQDAGVSSAWSDFQVDANVQSPGANGFFADASVRKSTGFYADPTQPGIVAGTIGQSHVDAGVFVRNSVLSARAGVAAYSLTSDGGTGAPLALSTHLIDPSIDVQYAPAPQWSASIASTEYFRIPSLLELYTPPAAGSLQLSQAPVVVAKIGYGDLHRLRFEAVKAGGQTQASGGSVAWAIAPNLSLRAWSLAFSNSMEGTAAVASSLWATYDNPAGLRIDAVERRDLIDTAENQHLDASLSVPAGAHLRWYAGTERRRFDRLYRTGLLFTP